MIKRPPPHLIAREGWIFVASAVLLGIAALRLGSVGLTIFSVIFGTLSVLLFRDPHRDVPSAPLAALSPVDGKVVSIEYTDKGCLEREATLITIRVDSFGAYSARSPVEGKVLNLQDNYSAGSRLLGVSGLWVRTDENDDIVVLLDSPRWPRPRSFVSYGERLGQGRRFGFLRLTRTVRVYLPIRSRVEVAKGDYVRSGVDSLALIVRDRDTTV